MKRDNESGIGGDDDGDVSDAEEFEVRTQATWTICSAHSSCLPPPPPDGH